jgi:hypothetical protein
MREPVEGIEDRLPYGVTLPAVLRVLYRTAGHADPLKQVRKRRNDLGVGDERDVADVQTRRTGSPSYTELE